MEHRDGAQTPPSRRVSPTPTTLEAAMGCAVDPDEAPPALLSSRLSDAQLVSAVATLVARYVHARDCDDEIPAELQPFDESGLEGPAFDGTEAAIADLLGKIVKCGLDASALVVALAFIARLVSTVVRGSSGSGSAKGASQRVIPKSAVRPVVLTMILLASKFNFDVGVRMKHLRGDGDVFESLGQGLVSQTLRLEEHVLTLFNWQLRVSASDYVETYCRIVECSQGARFKPQRVHTVPAGLSALERLETIPFCEPPLHRRSSVATRLPSPGARPAHGSDAASSVGEAPDSAGPRSQRMTPAQA